MYTAVTRNLRTVPEVQFEIWSLRVYLQAGEQTAYCYTSITFLKLINGTIDLCAH